LRRHRCRPCRRPRAAPASARPTPARAADVRAPCPASTPASGLTVALALALGLPAARAAAQPGAVTVGVTAEGETGVVSNPRFQAAADSADVLSRARAGLTIGRRSARTAFAVTTDGEIQHFQGAPDLSHTTYGTSAIADARLTPRLDLRGTAGVRTSLSRDVVTGTGTASAASGTSVLGTPDVGDTGVRVPGLTAGTLPLLPLSLSRTYTAQAGATYRTTPRTTVAADASVDRIRYDASALASGTSARVQLTVAHQLTNAAGVSLTVDDQRTQTGPSILTAESATLGWDTRLLGAAQLRLRAGAGAYAAPQHAPTLAPVGSAELGAAAFGGTWTVRYLRDVSPLLGVGQVLATDQAAAAYSRVAPGGLLLRAGVEQAWVRIPTTPGPRTVTSASFADVRRPIAGGLWIGAGASRRSRTEDPTVRSQNIGLTAGYAGSW
ncbi:MAG TPA: hypothetical protein VGD56_06730, partial [Gemmatirosa sp.]